VTSKSDITISVITLAFISDLAFDLSQYEAGHHSIVKGAMGYASCEKEPKSKFQNSFNFDECVCKEVMCHKY
jgi:hypothetical protein